MARRTNHLIESSYINETLTPSQMKRLNRKSNKNARQQQKSTALPNNVVSIKREEEVKARPIVPKTENQRNLLASLRDENCVQVIGMGSAGTGKTFITVSYAAELFRLRKIKKIVLTRPNVSTGRTLGLFKGDMHEKFMHWLQPLVTVLKECIGQAAFDIAVNRGDIVLQPLETIRGMSFEDSFVIVDEAQNTLVEEMQAIVTRIGDGTKLVLTGDTKQSDIRGESGLAWVKRMVTGNEVLSSMSSIVEFTSDDIVRSPLVKAWIKAIEAE